MGCSGSKGAAAKSPGDKSEDDTLSSEEQRIVANMNHKRRYQNVFAESIDVSDKEVQMTPAMEKNNTQKTVIKDALQKGSCAFVFATLSGEELDKFVTYMEKQSVDSGEKVIKQGDTGDFFYVVEKGNFDFYVGKNKVGSCESGASFGELALLYNAPRAATVQASSPGVLWKLNRSVFRMTLANSSSKQKEAIMSALSRVELLAGLTDAQLEQVTDAVQIVKYGPNHRIIEKGTHGDIFYMIQTGQVKCTDIGDPGQFEDVTLGPSDYFGEKSLLTNDMRAANVTSVTDVTLLVLDRENFQQVLGPLKELLDENLNLRVIQSVDILSKLSEKERLKAAKLFKLRPYPAGVNMITQGEDGNEFFIIKSGMAKVTVEMEGGAKNEVKTLKAGSYIGEMAMLSAEKRSATVTTTEATEAFVLVRDDFVKAFGPLKDIMKREAVERMGEIEQAVKEAARNDIKFEDLEVVAVLGSGTFGRVKLMKHKGSGEAFALKTMHKSEIVAHRQQSNVMHEKNIMVQSQHPFILRLFNTYKDAHRLYMLLEFVQGGELFTVLHTPTADGVPVKHAKFYSACVVMGLGYLHAKSIAYRDLKPENIMVDKTGYPKIVDFGFAKVVKNKTYTLCGTPEYLAPEIVLGRGHNKSVDWWAVGVLVYEMVAGYSPFSDPHGMDQVVICQNIVNGRLSFPNKFDAGCRDIVKKLLQRDPVLRLGSGRRGEDDIREHRFFEKTAWDAYLAKTQAAPWIPQFKDALDTSLFEPYEINDAIDPNYVDSGNWDKDF